MERRKATKIFLGAVIFIFSVFILSLLLGANWIMSLVLYFSDDVLCEDMNHDGNPDFCQYWKEGELIRLEWDTNFDGRIDVWQHPGKKSELFEMDSNFDGKLDYVEEETGDGKVVIRIDSNYDGTFDRTERTKPKGNADFDPGEAP